MLYGIYSKNTSRFLEIHTIGYAEDPQVTRFGPGRRNQYIIHYILSGSGYYNGSPVFGGQGFLITPQQAEEYYPDKDNPWKFLYIIAGGDLMEDIFAKYNADAETKIFSYDSIPVVSQIANYVIKNNNKTMDLLRLTEIFLHILNSHIDDTVPSVHKTNAEIYTDFCVNYVENNIFKKITVNELTELLGVSQPYLYKIFSERFNVSIKEYITTAKLKHAKTLLAETDMSITEIANSVGFEDIHAFSKVFKLSENFTPTEYRKKKINSL